MPRTVAALYVDERGPYAGLPGVDVWGISRDARLYAGPHPVVAHPPCERWGGVLEHPADSKAWPAHGLASPPVAGGWVPADAVGGWTCRVDQGQYGHRARKATWLYAYLVPLWGLRFKRAPHAPGSIVHDGCSGDGPCPGCEACEWPLSIDRGVLRDMIDDSKLSEADRAELAKFRQWCGIEASRRAGGDPGVLDALEAALYPEGIGRIPSGGAPEA